MIQFYKNRRIFYGFSLVIFLIGIVCIFLNGVSFDITFSGGSLIKYEYTGADIDTEKAAKIVEDKLGRLATCQINEEAAIDKKFLVVNLAGNEGLSSDEQQTLGQTLDAEFKETTLSLYETSIVEPFIGRKFLEKSLFAIILAFILIVIYVWYAFRRIGGLSAGAMALVALFHDILIVFFVFVIFKMPIDENFVAAALTIIGFSVNDTIIIYDRIRENSLLFPKLDTETLVNKSITQSLTRSINTSVAVFVSITMVYIFAQIYGISSIISFALPMMFGTVSGSYSTICLAGPLWVSWKNHVKKQKLENKKNK